MRDVVSMIAASTVASLRNTKPIYGDRAIGNAMTYVQQGGGGLFVHYGHRVMGPVIRILSTLGNRLKPLAESAILVSMVLGAFRSSVRVARPATRTLAPVRHQ